MQITMRNRIAHLLMKPLGERLLISQTMLRYDHAVFLDDLTPADVERELHVKLVPVPNDGAALLEAMRGC